MTNTYVQIKSVTICPECNYEELDCEICNRSLEDGEEIYCECGSHYCKDCWDEENKEDEE